LAGRSGAGMSPGVTGKFVIRFAAVSLIATKLTSAALAAENAALIPDLAGPWARNSFAYENPSSGLGPVENVSRLPSGIRDRTTLVGDTANPILTPRAAEAVRRFGEISSSGAGFPDPNNQCWPEGPPYVFRVLETQLLQQPDKIVILYTFDHQARHIYLDRGHPARVTPVLVRRFRGPFRRQHVGGRHSRDKGWPLLDD
jgi:hypothetical protein